ncbi:MULTISPECIES: aminoglycoside phosphotransferase family protein [Exiguobacterium]|uniref:phosphotransferase n=1 Tax=Exiguobacterium TaxID=33986 RepID=UPI001AE89773|nr:MULTISPECIES: aminoglycoside phosphotransferase family protein [Exiguobacterium]MCT4779611.1 aminoglycoside phosphotransferase family protein [Exiguobacterium soli]
MNSSEQEERLTGGNVSDVSRVGETVRREQKPDSDRIHRLLHHLEKRGFTGSPRFLGIDAQNREIVSFIEGEAGNYPLQPYMRSDVVLEETARLLRAYHEAVADFPIPTDWQPIDGTPEPFELICHNDFAVYNVIFQNERPVGIIDFDVAAPGPRIWDIVYTMYTFVPLSRHQMTEAVEPTLYDPAVDQERIRRRIELFLTAYGKPELTDALYETVLLRIQAMIATIHRKAAEGDEAFQRMIEEGHVTHYEQELDFLKREGADWFR